jgi:excinuclease ABC subunit A
MEAISVRGAREHNLKNIDLTIPRNRLVVITGVSGSGKSTLAFDTLFAEGQRRYVESLSAYARQFLQQMEKPDVDSIEGLSPAISIEQKTVSKNPRSTVGTVTEIHDYLRLLFASIGVPHCPSCGQVIRPQTVQQMVDRVLQMPEGTRLVLYAPYVRGKKGEYRKQLAQMAAEGFIRARIDGEVVELSGELPSLDKQKRHDIDIVIDRLVVKPGIERRLGDSLETALKVGGGVVTLAPGDGPEETLSQSYACAECGTGLAEITPRLFSFNSPYGACTTCGGLGTLNRVDPERAIVDPERSIAAGCIGPWPPTARSWRMRMLRTLAKEMDFSLSTPWNRLPEKVRHVILWGSEREMRFELNGKKSSYRWRGTFEGVIPRLERRYRETDSAMVRGEIERYMSVRTCDACQGKRLKPEALAVTVGGHSIDELSGRTVESLRARFAELEGELSERERRIADKILDEIIDRLSFLEDVGVGYLTLDRTSATLSGGESQRIRLATQIGSKLMGVLYVLDEPSIGLHQRDNARLVATLKGMRDLGNSVLVVEHDEETILQADWVVDLGPGAGAHGGEVVAEGPPEAIARHPTSLTGRYLRGEEAVPVPARRPRPERWLTVHGARHHNLKGIDAAFPVGRFTVVTGVSGSGKSSLVDGVLHKALAGRFHWAGGDAGEHERISGLEHLDKVIAIDQSPIGRTPRSNPATYTKVFAPIRELMSMTPEARMRGYKPGRFSFNVKGGRCEACRGEGQIKIEMHFLPDIYVACEVCGGKRYGRETLEVRYKGLDIAEILELTVEQARELFRHVPAIERILNTLEDVGLGYLHLGQPATTLSGGEAQRVKLAAELSRRGTGRTLYLLDEPTTGLHFDDVRKLLRVLHQLVDKGNTVVVIEHNLDVIKTADWVLDLGPEGGAGGGEVVAAAPPEEVAEVAASYTGQYLRRVLGRAPRPEEADTRVAASAAT